MKLYPNYSLLILLLITLTFGVFGQEKTDPNNQSEELGKVTWYRDYDVALRLAKQENKAILILFQEVPGCSTCRNYGHNVLTHPLMVEAIENSFIPLAIYNNKNGKDREVLEKYREPTWNNPVVRIVGADGKDLVGRIGGDYSANTLINRMQEALQKNSEKGPNYMTLLRDEIRAQSSASIETTYFKMYCFWSGEKHFGQLEGVLATEAGFMNGHEVVKVKFDSQVISRSELLHHAEQGSCTPIQKSDSYRLAKKDLKYYLQRTNYKYLPLTPLQQLKINTALGNGESALKYLSPQQLAWFKMLRSKDSGKEVLFNASFKLGWGKLQKM